VAVAVRFLVLGVGSAGVGPWPRTHRQREIATRRVEVGPGPLEFWQTDTLHDAL